MEVSGVAAKSAVRLPSVSAITPTISLIVCSSISGRRGVRIMDLSARAWLLRRRGAHAIANYLHVFAIRAIQARRHSPRHPTQEHQLGTMVDEMVEQLIPEYFANRDSATIEEGDGLR
jgi:hypothetical protein